MEGGGLERPGEVGVHSLLPIALEKLHGQGQALWAALCQGLEQTQGKRLNVRMVMLLSDGHDIRLCYSFHQSLEGNDAPGPDVHQGAPQVLAVGGRR